MKKNRSIRRKIRFISYILAAVVGLVQPCTILVAAPNEDVTDSDAENIEYIIAFEELSEDDSYLSCMYKPTLEELEEVFPTTLFVQLEEEDDLTEIEVTWECEDDFDDSEYLLYTFYPSWDEEKYAISDSVKDTIEVPSIMVEVPAGLIKDLEEARDDLQDILEEKSVLALVYLCDEYEVKEEASYEESTLATVSCGQSVLITGVDLDENGNIWYQVTFYQDGNEYTGYIERGYLATSDEEFALWEEEHINFEAMPMVMAFSAGCPDVDQFPASYQNALYALKEAHPNWIFVKMDTGLDWNTVIANERGEKSLIHSSCSGSWQNGTYGQGWSYASDGILKYYMDPRNFLSDPYIFQFEQLTYNDSYHTKEAVQEIIKSSFMSSGIPGDSRTYAQAFQEIGKSLDISPFHLASRVLQEQGSQGTSPLISGSYSGYEGYYNYFNVGASGKTNLEVIISGLKTAKENGWNTRYKSLNGGAYVIGANYITKGQDTLYLEKFNVSNGQHANYTHQYMQNIQAPASEAKSVRKAYYNAGALDNSFVFKIPVYKNMPASACSKPDTTDSLTLDKTNISDLEVNKTTKLTPYINGSKVDNVNDMTFTSSNTAVATVDSQGKITAVAPGTTTVSCARSGANTASCTVTVIKATPNVTTPTLSPVTYKEGLKLSEVSLPEGWSWEKGDTLLKAGTVSYSAVYTPEDTTKYNKITRAISFTVTRAIPDCQVPENLTAETGSTLGNIALPGGFAWESDVETELNEAGEYTFYVSYNPDESSYYTVNHIPVIVQVTGEDVDDEEDEENTSSGGNGSSTSGGSGTTTGGGSSTGGGNSTGGGSSTGTGSGSSGGSTGGGSGSNTTTSSGSTNSGTDTSTSSGSTSNGSTSNGSTSNTGSGSNTTTGSGSTNGGSTGNGSSTTSGGSTSNAGSGSNTTTSSGSTSNAGSGSNTTTSSGSTSNAGSSSNTTTSSGSTSNAGNGSNTTTGSGSTNSGSVGSGSSTTSSGSTSNGSTSNAGSGSNTTTSSGSTNSGSAGSGSSTTSSGSTSNGSTSNAGSGSNTTIGSGSTNSGSVGSGSTSNGSTGNAGSGSNTTTGSGSTNSGSAGSGSSISTSNESANNAGSGSNTTTGSGSTNGGSTGSESDTSTNSGSTSNADGGDGTATASETAGNSNNTNAVNTTAENTATDQPVRDGAVAVDSQNVLSAQNFTVEQSTQENEEVTYEKPSVIMEMDDTTILTVEKLLMAKEKDFMLELHMGNQAVWSINAASADTDALTEVDMGITFGTDDIPMELLDGLADGNEYLQFTLAHDGPFAFEAVLEVTLNPEDCGRYANLFYYNPETKELEFVCDAIIDAEGKAHFQMEHASSYVIIVSDQPMSGLLNTGSGNGITKWFVIGVLLMALLAAAGSGVFFLWKKKQEDEEEDVDSEDESEDIEEDAVDEAVNEEAEEDEAAEEPELEAVEMNFSAEDEWIEDKDWEEPEKKEEPQPEPEPESQPQDDNSEDDWIDDDEWDDAYDWIDDDEWERKNGTGKDKPTNN